MNFYMLLMHFKNVKILKLIKVQIFTPIFYWKVLYKNLGNYKRKIYIMLKVTQLLWQSNLVTNYHD